MPMHGSLYWRDALGLLSVVLAVLAAVITIAQTLRGEVRPHPR
jgi:NO-binding membrane sensor protein with MHYT domain